MTTRIRGAVLFLGAVVLGCGARSSVDLKGSSYQSGGTAGSGDPTSPQDASVEASIEASPDSFPSDTSPTDGAEIDSPLEASVDGPLNDAPEPDAQPETGPDAGPPLEVRWTDCDSTVPASSECAFVQVPMDHTQPDGLFITAFVKRFPAPVQPARGQVWLLQGGPGGDGASLEFLVSTFMDLAPDLDVYLPDHRGTGQSTKLECPKEESDNSRQGPEIAISEVPPCVAYLESQRPGLLKLTNTTQAAYDIGRLIESTRQPNQEAFVWGASYGTYWGLRYLQVFPNQATGVVLDSIAGPGASFLRFDTELNKVAREMFALCGADPFCRSKLGTDPWARLEALTRQLRRGHCPTSYGLNADTYRSIFGGLMFFPFDYRSMLPALVYRIERCDPADERAIETFVEFFSSAMGINFDLGDGYSRVTRINIGSSELVSEPVPSLSQVQQDLATTLVATGNTPTERRMYDAWPRYEHDAYWNQYPNTTTPLLMLNGTLDAQTTIGQAELVGKALTGPHQTFVALPRATHGVINESPLAGDRNKHCGAIITQQFLTHPTSKLEVRCTDLIAQLDFVGDAGGSALFGTYDAWENDRKAGSPKSLSDQDRVRIARALRAAGLKLDSLR